MTDNNTAILEPTYCDPEIAPLDYMDELEILNRLTIPQLRREVRWAKDNSSLSEHYFTPEFPYPAWGRLCQRCLNQLVKQMPKSKPAHGQIDIAAVKSRVDIVDVINGYVDLKPAGRQFKTCCPFHAEKTPSFVVNPDRQSFHCFGCQAHGDVISFVMRIKHCGFREAAEVLR